MCTTISSQAAVSGSGKGGQGWFKLDRAYLGYDHPAHASVEHAVLLDFVNEAAGPQARVAVELSLDSARAVVAQLTQVIEEADGYEAR